jgi:hypothetical protein
MASPRRTSVRKALTIWSLIIPLMSTKHHLHEIGTAVWSLIMACPGPKRKPTQWIGSRPSRRRCVSMRGPHRSATTGLTRGVGRSTLGAFGTSGEGRVQ